MLRISKALADIINEDAIIQFGLSNRLFNLTRLTNYLKPLVETRVKKEITDSSLLMELSRQQRRFKKILKNVNEFKIESLNLITDLSVVTFSKDSETHRHVNTLYQVAVQHKHYMTLTEGNAEITIIIDSYLLNLLKDHPGLKPKHIEPDISAISIHFSDDYVVIPGFIHAVLQRLTVQGINIIEITSTYSELVIYVQKIDTKLTFDTLFNCF